ncbi:hypothetical protein [Barrientosiimonas endolithica]|uniref:ABC transporter Uup C-terminal domain-containing protein n=1 Tax=Barrientosiimonas endolithica TaxID=1535208 RepID=A0ABM8HE31_9MICO|nr:hypothetical protein [Barrientosiimonas endolithica]BDZ59244.1 hypothetical protein GCM10025872_29010 [Barrientosiimonas endolithica]
MGSAIEFLGEPTNDLDIETLTSMEDVLDGWAGTLLVVSHDRYLLERMCDRQVALLGDGRIRELPGGVEQYLQLRHDQQQRTSRTAAAQGSSATGSSAGGSSGAASGSSGAGSGGLSAAEERQARKDLARAERTLNRLHEREQKLHDQLVEAASDHARAAELDRELRGVQEEQEAAELAWLEAAEKLG